MLLYRECICAGQKTTILRNFYKNVKFKPDFVPPRRFFLNYKSRGSDDIKKRKEENKLKPLSGIDDENYFHNLKLVIRDKKLLKSSFVNFLGEFKKFYNEGAENFSKNMNPRMDDTQGRVDMLYTFETQNDVNKFSVNTDSSYNSGYSSASLKLTNEGTAVFSGNICSEVPKDGNLQVAGYANMLSHKQWKSFFRPKTFDWRDYTDLVFKIRGDGRTYMILLNLDTPYEETKYNAFGQYLYTRGGPYWQIAKMRFSHFFEMTKGKFHNKQNNENILLRISRFGITAAGYDGPFKLEIDYIGLEYDERFKTVCAFESYK